MRIVLPPNDIITLSSKDFLTSGGEGSIYKRGSQLFKIYAKPPGTELIKKVDLLSKLHHEGVICPISVIYNEQQNPIGFNMNYISGEPLVKAFTNDWRTQENFTNEETIKLVERLRAITQFAHDSKALIVDGNEMNYIVQRDKPFIIDVDSWQIGSFKATAIMNSIKDFTSTEFSELTDWYSWAIVTFQVFCGIHPYKGRHPDFKMGELEPRVKAHVSVFNKQTRIPQAARDFSNIPKGIKEWYFSVLEDGQRSVPPLVTAGAKADFTLATKTYRTVQISQSSVLTFAKVRDYPLDIVSVFPCGIVLLKDASVYDLIGRCLAKLDSTKAQIIAAPIVGYIAIFEKAGKLVVQEIAGAIGQPVRTLDLNIACKNVIMKDGRVFYVSGDKLVELIFHRPIGSPDLICTTGKVWSVLENSTMFFKGFGVMDALKSKFLVLPFGSAACAILRAKELDNQVIIQGTFNGNLVSLLTIDPGANVVKFEFSMSDDYSSYSLWFGKTDLSSGLNIVVKNNVAVTIVNDNELSVFSTKGGDAKVIHDKNILTDMKLYMSKGDVHFVHDKSLWHLSM